MTTIESNIQHHEVEEEEEEDEWMEVYAEHFYFSEVCGKSVPAEYHCYRYYQCWGGGPEGGFITNKERTKTYRVNRDWYTPFTIEPVDGVIEVGYTWGVKSIRIVA